MKKGLGKRLVSLILCAAMLVTMAPDLIYAAQGDRQNVTVQKESGENADAEEAATTETAAAQQSEDRTEKSLEYALNGGSFVEGYDGTGHLSTDGSSGLAGCHKSGRKSVLLYLRNRADRDSGDDLHIENGGAGQSNYRGGTHQGTGTGRISSSA